ncbi:MAG: hypothetical protein AAB646_01270 [Patescibacteria group bacterium]
MEAGLAVFLIILVLGFIFLAGISAYSQETEKKSGPPVSEYGNVLAPNVNNTKEVYDDNCGSVFVNVDNLLGKDLNQALHQAIDRKNKWQAANLQKIVVASFPLTVLDADNQIRLFGLLILYKK